MDIRFARAVAVGLALTASPMLARADAELALGFANNVEDEGNTGVATLAWVTRGERSYEFQIGHIESRADDGGPISPTSTFVAASRRLTWGHWYGSSGIALADTDDDNRVLSGPLQFLTAVGWSAEDWSVSLRHLSNAGIAGRNHGETYLMVAVHF